MKKYFITMLLWLIVFVTLCVNNSICVNESKNLRISIIVPCDRQHICHLQGLLRAYEQQTVLPDEIVISVSRIEGNSKKMIEDLKTISWQFPVRYFMSEQRLYAGTNRNRACQEAIGDVLICQDADDLPMRHRVEVVKYMFSEYEVDYLIHSYLYTHEANGMSEGLNSVDMQKIPIVIPSDQASILRIPKLCNGNVAITKKLFGKIRWPYSQQAEDVEFSKQVYRQKYKCMVVLDPLIIYRQEYSCWAAHNS